MRRSSCTGRIHRLLPIVVLLSIAGVPACSDKHSVYPVRGRVVDVENKPAAGAMLIFHPSAPDPKDSSKPVATVDEDGNFTLTTYKAGDGAPAGEYVITITWPGKKKSPFDRPEPDKLKGRYADPATSALRYTVENNPGNEVSTIVLK